MCPMKSASRANIVERGGLWRAPALGLGGGTGCGRGTEYGASAVGEGDATGVAGDLVSVWVVELHGFSDGFLL